MSSDVILRGPLGELAKRLSPEDRLLAEEVYAAAISLWSAAIAHTVTIHTWSSRPVTVWTAFSTVADRPAAARESVASAMNAEEDFPYLDIRKGVTTASEFRRAIGRGSEAGPPARTLLVGNPFRPLRSGWKILEDLDLALRPTWDGPESFPSRPRGSHPSIGVLWDVPGDSWTSGLRSLSEGLFSRLLPFKASSSGRLRPTQQKEWTGPLVEANAWATAKPRKITVDGAAGRKLDEARVGEDSIRGVLAGDRARAFGGRLGEHTLRVATVLAASEEATVVRSEVMEAAWTLVRRSVTDTVTLIQDLHGPVEAALAELDSVIYAIEHAVHAPRLSAPAREQIPNGAPDEPVSRNTSVVQSLERDSRVVRWVKQLYGHACQMCGTVLTLPKSRHSQGAHIQALGAPHGGPDRVENVLCLCPNCHVLFDYGARYLTDDLHVVDAISGRVLGALTVCPEHHVGVSYVRQHRSRWVSD
ncbi:HNH endonuclease [Streptomyces albus]|uniref:HNH endonuclease n=1 Tax=Streptomyces albus TaxID=1888 RepID=UPI003F1CDCC6